VDEKERQIITDHDPAVIVEKIKREYSAKEDSELAFFPAKDGWTPTKWMSTWLPFGYMCLHAIALKYDDSGVTDAITKYAAYLSTKPFTP
jgi:hypothetical protein